MEDTQGQIDHRGIPIDQVGVRHLRYPITVWDRNQNPVHTVAHLSLSVSLPQHFKGTHMSRFMEVLNQHRGEMTMRTLPALLDDLLERLEAEQAQVRVEFPYFLDRSAPVSGAVGLMDYDCWFDASSDKGAHAFSLGVRVPVTNLCPCSKNISDYGAHNQRGYVAVELKTMPRDDGQPEIFWIEEIIDMIERSASAPVYPILKREDERHVTMQAYDNPRFVEDCVREVAGLLQEDGRTAAFRVEVDNQESIHNHDAFAVIVWERPVTA